ncbi:amino acid ABC transporter permease [Brucella pseudogrignonensis]|uniref:Amino ABC transporter, permease, 3-TM region, His/Glu/Gln/Arg/opine family domain protein n=1 Tax=Brucella rhizosphaerae TaxID=571254 RepID=A0A256FQT0_9HYPH|nr:MULTISPECIES: amino acid ABC transporter permease [Brucella]MDT6942350.1 amino acid ABC transporter permease [Brucella pseudogrignonensis]OYR17222.1 amino ABC transporter, permease, 3-TM region, His/Glu/Gln/Arg/opine family domain protein [Brucella rhizosphaerae]
MFWFQVERLWNFWPILLKGLGMTVSLSLLSLIIGVIVGLIFGVLRASGNRWLSGITGLYIDLFRGTPFLVQVFICFFILPSIGIELSAFNAGVIALSNLSACFIGEIIASGIKAVPRGQTEAAIASGFTYSQQLRLIVMPQALRIVRPSLVGQFILLVKDSSVVSAIGIMDLTRSGWMIVQNIPNGLLVFGVVGIGYFIVCYPMIYLSRRIERGTQSPIL